MLGFDEMMHTVLKIVIRLFGLVVVLAVLSIAYHVVKEYRARRQAAGLFTPDLELDEETAALLDQDMPANAGISADASEPGEPQKREQT